MPRTRRGPAIAAGALTLFLTLLSCRGHGHDSGGGPPGAQGAPPGRDGPGAPGAPVAPGGGHPNQGGGGAPGAPYQIPSTVEFGPIVLNDEQDWAFAQSQFWAACPGGTHCVELVRVYRTNVPSAPCVFDHVDPPVGRHVPYHSVIYLIGGGPCTGSSPGGGSPDVSAPPSGNPDSAPPSAPPVDPQESP
jgi:hypothetical protein